MMTMNDEQIVQYVKDMILGNLNRYGETTEIICIMADDEYLLEHIKGVMALFKKAKEILERRKNDNDKGN